MRSHRARVRKLSTAGFRFAQSHFEVDFSSPRLALVAVVAELLAPVLVPRQVQHRRRFRHLHRQPRVLLGDGSHAYGRAARRARKRGIHHGGGREVGDGGDETVGGAAPVEVRGLVRAVWRPPPLA